MADEKRRQRTSFTRSLQRIVERMDITSEFKVERNVDRMQKENMRKNKDPIHIIADDRESKSDVIKSLSEIENVDLSIQRLSMGDYQVENRLIVERKTLKDFAISIIDGRLFKQMIRLANSNSKSALILEGTAIDTAEIGMTREAMQGALITVSLILGIPILRSKDPSETARLIVYIGRQIETMARGGVQRHGYRPKGQTEKTTLYFTGIAGSRS